MGGKNSSPDYAGAAAAQGEANREVVRDQTFANRPDQYTPWGATTWTPYQATDPATGEATTAWDQTQSLTPELQDILNKQIAIQSGRSDVAGTLTGRLGAEFGTPMDWRGLNPMGQVPTAQFTLPENIQRGVDYSDVPTPQDPMQQTTLNTAGIQGVDSPQQQMGLDYSGIMGVGDGSYYRDRAENSIYDKGASRLQPKFDEQRRLEEVKMRNQGLGPEDAAWKARMGGIGEQETDAYGQLQNDAIMGGMAESNQMFGQDMSRRGMYTGERDRQAQFGNESQQNMFNMQTGLRGQQFGERQTQGQFGNQAAQDLYGMQADSRDRYTGERDRAAAFYNQSGQQAFNQSNQANQQNFGQAMQGSAYANQIRQQQLTEAMTKRGFSLNEINGLLSGQQVNTPQMPSFTGASAAQAAPIYQGAVDQGNFNQMGQQGLYSGLGGLASAGLSAYTGGLF